MTYKETHKPAIGSMLHLGLDYWQGENKTGAEAKVVKSRKEKKCSSGLRITVELNGVKNPVGLCARWFLEYGREFVYRG